MADKLETIAEYFSRRLVSGEVGIEIEVEGERLPAPSSNKWTITGDGSLRGRNQSAEYVLRGPVKRDDVPKVLESLKEDFRKARGKVDDSERCGVHVHINCQQLTHAQAMNFIILAFMMEPVLFQFIAPHRRGNLFCLSPTDADELVFNLYNARQQGNWLGFHGGRERYASINIGALERYGSIEFRAMHTPQDFMDIQKWVKMLLAIKDYSLKIEDPRDFVRELSMRGPNQFARNVFGDIPEVRQTPDETILNAVRVMQDVCYVQAPPPRKRQERKKRTAKPEAAPPQPLRYWPLTDASKNRIQQHFGFRDRDFMPIDGGWDMPDISHRDRGLLNAHLHDFYNRPQPAVRVVFDDFQMDDL